ncbi:tryptophan synthase alpha chain [Kribbella orskensis]|uniref:Tryptophan synthase alpha chain n=1 Tax=Kribbella orskensis TaxID=2512216 RepID=A0ABY2BR98_9ACTN|nr:MULTISPECIES: tryptophan synthase subunit alpha [Kribbella]TCN43222.1 tryptophan synthase alpha chain [Kribbella sp. VKM Ac-2500]TCO29422.1 tryptophan synthase alpha chain [Kribbella orskensis]
MSDVSAELGNAGTAIRKANDEGRAALVGYLPAGYPTIDGGVDAIKAMVDGGVDVLEIGLPYSDPVMDGVTIQRAAEIALAGGLRIRDVLGTVEKVAAYADVPVLVMTYWNPIERYGVDRFAVDLAAAGGAGLITPDLIPDEGAEWIAAADKNELDKVFLVSPSSTDARIGLTTASCRGFVYATAVMGVTGARDQASDLAAPLVARTKATTGLPVGVGLGVSDADQAADVAAYADAVIVGSAFVKALDAGGPAGVKSLTESLAEGVRRERSTPVAR